MRLGTIILAAGASHRMGKSKLLLPWGNTSIIGHIIYQWTHLGACQVAIVCRSEDSLLKKELDSLKIPETHRIYNPEPERGMFSSIQCAARWTGWRNDLSHWVVTLGDQPHISRLTLETLVRFALIHPHQISVPSQAGHRRHPVVLPPKFFRQLKDSQAADLRHFLDQSAPDLALCELDDPALGMDLDYPQDYEKAVRLHAPDQQTNDRTYRK